MQVTWQLLEGGVKVHCLVLLFSLVLGSLSTTPHFCWKWFQSNHRQVISVFPVENIADWSLKISSLALLSLEENPCLLRGDRPAVLQLLLLVSHQRLSCLWQQYYLSQNLVSLSIFPIFLNPFTTMMSLENDQSETLMPFWVLSALACKRTFIKMYWAIQRSWFARVNALCNLLRKKSWEVAVHFRADFWVGVASRCV